MSGLLFCLVSSAHAERIVGVLMRTGDQLWLVQDLAIAEVFDEPVSSFRLELAPGVSPFLRQKFLHAKVGRFYAVEGKRNPIEFDSNLGAQVTPTVIEAIYPIEDGGPTCGRSVSL